LRSIELGVFDFLEFDHVLRGGRNKKKGYQAVEYIGRRFNFRKLHETI
jgi:hypothetical protein